MLTVLLLIVSNTFMITAWYGNLKFPHMPTWQAIMIVDLDGPRERGVVVTVV